MKLFYSPTERLILNTDDPAAVILNKFLWDKSWSIWAELDRKESLNRKEVRLMSHIAGLLQL